MVQITARDGRFSSELNQTDLFLKWNDVDNPIDRLDTFTFVVNSSKLAQLHTDATKPTVYDGEICGGDKTISVRFRIRDIDGDRVLCGFFDLSIATRDEIASLVERVRTPETDELQTLSYDDLAKGKTDKVETAAPTSEKGLSTLKKALVSLMLALAMLIVGSWVIMVIRSQSTIAVSNGVMVGNYQAINTPLEGKLSGLRVAVGQRVEAGQVLGVVANPSVDHEYKIAGTKISRAKLELDAYRREARDTKTMLNYARAILKTKRSVAIAEKARIKSDLKSAQSQLKRQKRLRRNGHVRMAEYEKAEAARDHFIAELKAKKASIQGLVVAEKAAANEVIVNDDRVTNPMSEIRRKIALAEANLNEMTEMQGLYSPNAKPAELVAPSSGKIFAIYRRPGEVLKHADEVIAISRDGDSWASGHVPSASAAKIKPGQMVEIEIPSYGITTTGVVEGIGHRAVHGRGGYTADLRGGPYDVPIRVAIKQTNQPTFSY